jgi:hypothetical protein
MKLGVADPAACSAYMLRMRNPGAFSDDDDDIDGEDVLTTVEPRQSGVRLRELEEFEIDVVFDETA